MYEAYHLLDYLGALPEGALENIQAAFSGAIPPSVAHQLVNKYMIAFLKTHLAGETGDQHMLTPGWAITREPDIEFFVTEKKNPNAIDKDRPDMFTYFINQSGSETAKAYKDPEAVHRIPHVGFMK